MISLEVSKLCCVAPAWPASRSAPPGFRPHEGFLSRVQRLCPAGTCVLRPGFLDRDPDVDSERISPLFRVTSAPGLDCLRVRVQDVTSWSRV